MEDERFMTSRDTIGTYWAVSREKASSTGFFEEFCIEPTAYSFQCANAAEKSGISPSVMMGINAV